MDENLRSVLRNMISADDGAFSFALNMAWRRGGETALLAQHSILMKDPEYQKAFGAAAEDQTQFNNLVGDTIRQISGVSGIPEQAIKDRVHSIKQNYLDDSVTLGEFNRTTKEVTISPAVKKEHRRHILAHEIVHALQRDFAPPHQARTDKGEKGTATPVTPFSPAVMPFRNTMFSSFGQEDGKKFDDYVGQLKNAGVVDPEKSAVDLGLRTYFSSQKEPAPYPSSGVFNNLKNFLGMETPNGQTDEQKQWAIEQGSSQLTPKEQEKFLRPLPGKP